MSNATHPAIDPMALEFLREKYPWPTVCPDVPLNPDGWFCGENRKVLKDLAPNASIILELGAWLGMSTRMIVDWSGPNTIVITIDHWKGSSEHVGRPEVATLWETFVRNAWDAHRDRLIPMKTTTQDGMRELYELGVYPDLIYVDASHEADLVAKDLETIMTLFPHAHIVGDDWTWTSVREGVFDVIANAKRMFLPRTTCYEIFAKGVYAYPATA